MLELPKPNKIIMHIDLNSFFASAEQQANPFLRNKSMGVGKRGYSGSAILAASYPAKRQGINLSKRYHEAIKIDPSFELVELDPLKYYDLHNKFMDILGRYTPLIEVYSIDEAFLDFTYSRKSPEDVQDIAFEVKQKIIEEMGEAITCSVGIAPNKLLTKVASDYNKPDGITLIKWEDRFKFLDNLKLEDVWGIGRHVSSKMYKRGIYTVKQIRDLTDGELYSMIGGYYTRLRLIVNGYNFDPIETTLRKKPPQSMQHAHTLDKATRNRTELKSLAHKMAERLAFRLRKHNQKAKEVYIGFARANMGDYGWNFPGWFGTSIRLTKLSDHGLDIYRPCVKYIDTIDLSKTPIRRIVVGISSLTLPDEIPLDESQCQDNKNRHLDEAFDKINTRFGSFTLRTADILHQYAKETELSVDKHEMRFHGNLC